MVSLNDIKGVWNSVEDMFKLVTPKNDKIDELEKKIKIPFHYVLMIVAFLLLVFLIFFVKSLIFSNTTIFIISLIACMKNLCSDKRDDKKWYSFWFVFVMTVINPLFGMFEYFQLFKFFLFSYLAIYDDCEFIHEIIALTYVSLSDLFDLYVKKFCKDHSD